MYTTSLSKTSGQNPYLPMDITKIIPFPNSKTTGQTTFISYMTYKSVM